jgi:hypothetical protein
VSSFGSLTTPFQHRNNTTRAPQQHRNNSAAAPQQHVNSSITAAKSHIIPTSNEYFTEVEEEKAVPTRRHACKHNYHSLTAALVLRPHLGGVHFHHGH